MMSKSFEACTSKRRYSSHEESPSSNEENEEKTHDIKKPIEKKIRERTSPPTTDNDSFSIREAKSSKLKSKSEASQLPVSSAEIDKIVSETDSVSLRTSEKNKRTEHERQSSERQERNVEIVIEEAIRNVEERKGDSHANDKKNEENLKGSTSLKEEIKEIEEVWATIDGKRNISAGNKGPRDSFLYDFLGEEVDKDEAEALEALNFYWLNTVAKSAANPRTDIPEEHKEFYDKYCNGTRQLTAEAAMKLMTLPHVVTVTLKSNAKIEVVVSDVFLALQDSPELRHEDFEVVEAMGMHLF